MPRWFEPAARSGAFAPRRESSAQCPKIPQGAASGPPFFMGGSEIPAISAASAIPARSANSEISELGRYDVAGRPADQRLQAAPAAGSSAPRPSRGAPEDWARPFFVGYPQQSIPACRIHGVNNRPNRPNRPKACSFEPLSSDGCRDRPSEHRPIWDRIVRQPSEPNDWLSDGSDGSDGSLHMLSACTDADGSLPRTGALIAIEHDLNSDFAQYARNSPQPARKSAWRARPVLALALHFPDHIPEFIP